ncbi:hypothetical protein GCM10011575_42370 [Microlunatus endophyticus]|uniref:AAA+ ATPase domain-containing protein n=1 Tax=Microlunatus endophyticus TaxID=1716077 RepID=A0A917W940_9ACTN|nr:AAA family ATPase [Microlunatus endophyticus]GGL79569.1 hypothetical protein GCM10011575_42370 [Microlunatus endophyticus]
MRFEIQSVQGAPEVSGRPVAVLRESNWDDFGFRTLFGVVLHLPGGLEVDLGNVKIMRLNQEGGYTQMPGRSFDALDADFCSLGQDVEYYEKLLALPEPTRTDFLRSIRDAAYDREIRRRFLGTQAWSESLTRFGQASHALEVGRDAFSGSRKTAGVANFEYVRAGDSPLRMYFGFDDRAELPGRSNVIIGYNGVGKTRMLADLARAASERQIEEPRGVSLSGDDVTFGAVVAVSYSAFDEFELPQNRTRNQDVDVFETEIGRTELFGYVYCGLRRVEGTATAQTDSQRPELKSLAEIDQEFLNALERARHRQVDGKQVLLPALQMLEREPSYGRIGVMPSTLIDIDGDARGQIRQLSTGHKIVLNIVVQLAAHLRPRSLVLLDEPETHLHPPLLAALLKAIQYLLDAYDSFVVIATHSPVVLQEVPASCVRVLTRFGDVAEVEEPEIETFGENVGSITRYVFSLDSSATDYQGVLASLAKRLSVDQIEELFNNGLSDQARALVLRIQRSSS